MRNYNVIITSIYADNLFLFSYLCISFGRCKQLTLFYYINGLIDLCCTMLSSYLICRFPFHASIPCGQMVQLLIHMWYNMILMLKWLTWVSIYSLNDALRIVGIIYVSQVCVCVCERGLRITINIFVTFLPVSKILVLRKK